MKSLSRFETNLNRILRCFLGRLPLAEALPLLLKELDRPKCLTRDCVDLVQDTLAKGCTRRLAGLGWQHQQYLRGEAVSDGRLWQRHAPDQMSLVFSPASLKFLIHVTAKNFSKRIGGRKADDDLTAGDQVLGLLAYERLIDTMGEVVLVTQPMFGGNPLVRLMFVDHVAGFKHVCDRPLDWDWWFRQENAWILEAIQTPLAARWSAIELTKRLSTDDQLMVRMGRAQNELLNGYLDAANRAGRRDLCRFLLHASGQALAHFDENTPWMQRLRLHGVRLAERADFCRNVLASFKALERLADWQREALSVGFYDENYRASQFWKAEWESLGGELVCDRARQLIRSVSPI